jgi:hypothetical protein
MNHVPVPWPVLGSRVRLCPAAKPIMLAPSLAWQAEPRLDKPLLRQQILAARFKSVRLKRLYLEIVITCVAAVLTTCAA